jgi:glutamate N-acetyltransferase/amino-acid N-acetyltransferase
MFTYNDNGTITDVEGFKASGIHAGLRTYKKDLALIYSDLACEVAGVFTQNQIKAAPVDINEKIILSGKKVRAVLINSKCANACTGGLGHINAAKSQKYLSKELGIEKDEVLISSTGVIGTQLQIEKIESSIPNLVNELSDIGGHFAAEAILTTDTKSKSYSMNIELSSGNIKIGAICKGSGMVHPNMATMLGFLTTDAEISKPLLQTLLKKAVDQSFNKITVDSETSTNDMVLFLSNGASGNSVLEHSANEKIVYSALLSICKKMAKSIVADGEGASKLVTVIVKNSVSEDNANKIAEAVATSPLVKTALYGEDPNWGRIIAAIGYSGAEIVPNRIEISIGDHVVLESNFKVLLNESIAKKILKQHEITIEINMNNGSESSTWWTCDFSKEYVAINADYRS